MTIIALIVQAHNTTGNMISMFGNTKYSSFRIIHAACSTSHDLRGNKRINDKEIARRKKKVSLFIIIVMIKRRVEKKDLPHK